MKDLTEPQLTANKIIYMLTFNYAIGLLSLIPILYIDLVDIFKIVLTIVLECTCFLMIYNMPNYLKVTTN